MSIRIDFTHTPGITEQGSGVNRVISTQSIGLVHSNLIDTDSISTGLSLYLDNAPTAGGTSGALVSGDHYDIPNVEWVRYWIPRNQDGAGERAVLRITGLDANQQYSCAFFGAGSTAATVRMVTSDGNFDRVYAGGTTPITPNTPTAGTFTTDGDGEATFTFFRSDSTSTGRPIAGFYIELGAAPVVIDTVSPVRDGESVTITGTNFSATGNAVTIGGVAQTITAEGATEITITATRGANVYGPQNLVVTNAESGVSEPFPVQFLPATGWKHVTLVDPLEESGKRITAIPDLAEPDQVVWGNVQGGTADDVTINTDASFSAEASVTAFDVYSIDGITGSRSATVTQTVGDEDPSTGLTGPLAEPLTVPLTTPL